MTAADAGKGVLITRPEGDAGPLAGAVRSRGLDPVLAPLLEIVETGEDVALEGIQAVLLTSANGARALAHATPRRDLRVLAVGDATAGAARLAGFGNVTSADGDAESLAALAREACDPQAGPLLHAAGRDLAGDLAGMLESSGFTVRRTVLYRAETVTDLPEAARAALAGGALGAALFFSPRTAQTFVTLAEQAGVGAACRAVSAICLSGAIADAVGRLDWAEIRIAARPDVDSLLACLDSWVSNQSPENRVTETPKDKKAPWTGAADAGDSASETGGAEPKNETAPEEGAAPDAKAGPAPSAPSGRAMTARPAARGAAAAWMLTGLLAVLVVAGAAYISWPLWRDGVPGWARDGLAPVMEAGRGGAPAARLAALEEQLRAAQAAIGELRSGAPQAPSSSPDTAKIAALAREIERLAGEIESLRSTVQPLAGRLEALEQAGQGRGGSDLAARIEALQKRLDTIAQQQAGGDAMAGEAVAAIRAENDKRIAAVESENRALSEALAALRQQLGEFEAGLQARSGSARGAALIAAAGDLRAAVDSGRSYAQALDSLRAVAPKEESLAAALDTLGRYADKGVPTRDELRSRFDPMASAVSQAAAAPEGSGWLDQTIGRLSRLVTVRRTGEEAAQEDSVGGRLARAELRLAAGDLQGAVAALEPLSGAPAKAAAGWLAAAKARIEAEQALRAVSAGAIRRLGGAGDAAGG